MPTRSPASAPRSIARTYLFFLRSRTRAIQRSVSGKKLQDVAVGILEIDAAPAAPGVDLHVLLRERTASVWNAGLFDPTEDRVELRVADVESVVVHLEAVPVVEIEREGLVDPDRRKMTHRALVVEAEHVREKLCRRLLVMRRYDRVIQ